MQHDDLLNKEPVPIRIQSYELGPHKRKVIFLPKPSFFDNSSSKMIWVVASFIIGISIVSNFFNITQSVLAFGKSKLHDIYKEEVVIDSKIQDENPLGSDDVLATPTTTPKVIGKYFLNNKNALAPKVTALSYIIGDAEDGTVIKEKSSSLILPIASVSKIITALVSKEYLKLHDSVIVTRSSVDTYGTFGGLKVGEKILITDVLYPLLIESSNDAAEVLAFGLGRKEFVEKMNLKAKELEMKDTFFDDPSGLSEKNVSTAEDLFTLAKYITNEKPDIWDITRIRQYAILKHSWANGNRAVLKSNFLGGKNGYTLEANRTTVSVFEVPIFNEKTKIKERKKIAVILLKSSDRDADMDRLLRYVETNFRYTNEIGSIEDIK